MSTEARLVDTSFTTYDGPRAGRAAAIWSLARWSALRALGARRGWKVKVIPIALVLIAFAPALVVLGARALFGSNIITRTVTNAMPYSDYITHVSIVVLVFSVVITPELVCPDRRDRTLSLYFSTAIGRLDYVLGKIAAALLPLLLVTAAPVIFYYVGAVLFSEHPVGYLQDHGADVPRILGAGLVVALYYALVGLAISSLTSRRAFAVGGYLAFLLIPTIVGGVLSDALNERYLRLLTFVAAPIKVGQSMFPNYTDRSGVESGWWAAVTIAVCLVSAAVLAVRYRRDEG
jgi:ABC-2 type transport system permease protein